ncbi:MAG TPA: hypothetical protein VM734_26850 [Kofleriaceae bacterium]|nr:hypothetical protein [Kofleriaceae bacterium]
MTKSIALATIVSLALVTSAHAEKYDYVSPANSVTYRLELTQPAKLAHFLSNEIALVPDHQRDDLRGALRTLRARLTQLVKPGAPSGAGLRRSLSVVDLALDTLRPTDDSTFMPLEQLAPSEWWMLFVDPRWWHDPSRKAMVPWTQQMSGLALAFDFDQNPGSYHAMSDAYAALRDDVSKRRRNPTNERWLTPESYQRYHALVLDRVGTIAESTDNEKISHPADSERWSGGYVLATIADTSMGQELEAAVSELISGCVLSYKQTADRFDWAFDGYSYRDKLKEFARSTGLYTEPPACPHAPPAYVYVTWAETDAGHLDESSLGLKILNNSQAPFEATLKALIDDYYKEIEQANGSSTEKVKAIIRLTKGLHVAHFYQEGNGRTHFNILVNLLLMEQGLEPTLLPDTSRFAGRVATSKLLKDVEAGRDLLKRAISSAQAQVEAREQNRRRRRQ